MIYYINSIIFFSRNTLTNLYLSDLDNPSYIHENKTTYDIFDIQTTAQQNIIRISLATLIE